MTFNPLPSVAGQRACRSLSAALLSVLLLLPAPGHGQQQTAELATPSLAVLFQRAAEAWNADDHAAWVDALEQLHRMRPFNYDFMQQLVRGYALTGRTSEAFNMMLRMQQQGLAADWDAVDDVASLRRFPLYEHLRDLMAEAANPAGNARQALIVGREHAMPEALAHDPASGRIFVGTVRDGHILAWHPEAEKFEVFATPETVPGLWAVFDLHVDAERGHLWVATGSTGQYRHARRADYGRTALIRLDLDDGSKTGEFRPVPDGRPHLFGAMTMADDGTIYATDTITPVVYRLEPGAERAEVLAAHSVFTGLRGLALSDDEARLYVADYDLGIFFFDLANGNGYALGIPETLNLGGIDGLYAHDGHLIMIQNAVTPQRVLRLKLDDSGTRVAEVATLAKALPEFDDPTYGTMAGDELLFLARSHWGQVTSDGQPIAPPLPDVPVMRVSIDDAAQIVVGEEMLERIRRGAGPSGD